MKLTTVQKQGIATALPLNVKTLDVKSMTNIKAGTAKNIVIEELVII